MAMEILILYLNIVKQCNCTRCATHIIDEHNDTAENFDIIVSVYSFIKYSPNYSDTSGRLWQFQRDESSVADTGNAGNVPTNISSSFKYKSSILKIKPNAVVNNGVLKKCQNSCSTQIFK